MPRSILALLGLIISVNSSPLRQPYQSFLAAPSVTLPRPLVIWHGLGDTSLSDGIQSFIDDVHAIHPGIFVYSVQVPLNGSLDEQRRAGFYGDAEEQGQRGCEQISTIPELRDGFDAMGFSQGGLFLRQYAQYCSGPSIRNLITFGTPHYGIAEPIPCPSPPTLTCLLAGRAARAGIYRPWAQTHLVQAQYYRDPARMDEFLRSNTFIRDLNAEGKYLAGEEEGAGGRGLAGLENLVAIMFDQDRTVGPAESAHFATVSAINHTQIIPLYEQPLYTGDWIGLRTLDEKGRLRLAHCPGAHMDLGGKGGCAEMVRSPIVKSWVWLVQRCCDAYLLLVIKSARS
ncbi:MAG: hypothetical protein TREMPRED_001838 [Tremellales sp. Tagirdzhanova-0007]|nr:MAG: hypothetical protein TREMPRED_001838 [Tremellales sp. Tagirdzhanova-0007]